MIYLIKAALLHPTKSGRTEALKIGYTRNLDKRILNYCTHCPDIALIATREGDRDLENFLHDYFEDYRMNFENEWFEYNDKIINLFPILNPEYGTFQEMLYEKLKTDDQDTNYLIKEILEENEFPPDWNESLEEFWIDLKAELEFRRSKNYTEA